MKSLLLSLAVCAAAVTSAHAQVSLKVTDPWVRGTVAGQTATGAFMTLTAGSSARLVEARSAMAGVVEVHEMTMVDNLMKMRAVPALDLPAGKPVELKPGGYHVMMMGLKKPLQAGDSVPITLVIETGDHQRQSIEVVAPVRALAEPAHKHH